MVGNAPARRVERLGPLEHRPGVVRLTGKVQRRRIGFDQRRVIGREPDLVFEEAARDRPRRVMRALDRRGLIRVRT
jgi:hypothetical protein